MLPPEAIADPTGAVIREFGIVPAQVELMRRWGELIAAKLRGRAVPDIRTSQQNPHPMAIELTEAFGADVYRMKMALDRYHKASYEAALLRQGIG